MELTKMLTLSSGHLTPNTRAILDRNGDTDELNMTVYIKGAVEANFGWFVYLPELSRLTAVLDSVENLAPDLAQVVRWAVGKETNIGIICFDSDGPYEEELPYYDHCEWCGGLYQYDSDRVIHDKGQTKWHTYAECNDCKNRSITYLQALKIALADNPDITSLKEVYTSLYEANLEGADVDYIRSYEESYAPAKRLTANQTIREVISSIESLVHELCEDMGNIDAVKTLVSETGVNNSLLRFLFC